MSNQYCNLQQLTDLYDTRSVLQLSGDVNDPNGMTARAQRLLDMQASELDSWLAGRYALPITATVPLILTKWVAVTTARRLWGRRADIPKELSADGQWADEWIKMLLDGKVSLPGVNRNLVPTLVDSDAKDGSSAWDHIYGQTASPTGPTGDGSPAT